MNRDEDLVELEFEELDDDSVESLAKALHDPNRQRAALEAQLAKLVDDDRAEQLASDLAGRRRHWKIVVDGEIVRNSFNDPGIG